MTLEVKAVIPVAQEARQSGEEYHEQLRFLLNKTFRSPPHTTRSLSL